MKLTTIVLAHLAIQLIGARTIRRDFNVASYAALGDSFASGPSAGKKYDSSSCRRYAQAYGPQLAASTDIAGSKPMDFHFVACSGARAKHISGTAQSSSSGGGGKTSKPQAEILQGLNPDFVTLTIGGNDAKFVDVLDRCVFKFSFADLGCGGCKDPTSPYTTDCSYDCGLALDEMQARIESADLTAALTAAYSAIFKQAPGTKLFVMGYPRFWNAQTEECNNVSFKVGCPSNTLVLPLHQSRRQRMNDLTNLLNSYIESAVTNFVPPAGSSGSAVYVDPNPSFQGHGFCEAGISEPSYRNPDIWFYPFEYTTGGTVSLDSTTTGQNCNAIGGIDGGGDDGAFYTCLLVNSTSTAGATIDFSTWPNNVAGTDDLGTLSGANLPDFAARIFHPTIMGMTAMKSAALGAYHAQKPLASGVKLRVLPIGDSITWGAQSTDSNGYRNHLHNMLTSRGNTVDFVGSVQSGSMTDNQHEGHRGYIIDQIAPASSIGIQAGANIVLLHAGTNDINRNVDVSAAPTRLKALIDAIFQYNPDTVVLVAQIIPMNNGANPRVDVYNAKIATMVNAYVAMNKKVGLVDMNSAITIDDLADELHPNNIGYSKMARTWFAAINDASLRGWIDAPGPSTPTKPAPCTTSPTWSSPTIIARGASVAYDDGPFNQVWTARQRLGFSLVDNCPAPDNFMRFFDMDGDGVKDIVCIKKADLSMKLYRTVKDATLGYSWEDNGAFRPGFSADSGLVFADLNGDGRDDLAFVSATGIVRAYINQYGPSGLSWSMTGNLATDIGATADNLQFADINGDGLADLCLVNQITGEVKAWLNRGGLFFSGLGVIATGESKSLSPDDAVWLGDFTGEGRADYMAVGVAGKVNGYINRLQEGKGLIPRWEKLTIATGPDGAKRENVRLLDFDGDGKIDYLLVDYTTGNIDMWKNIGTGGKYQQGEGVFICDLDGDGIGDYFWVAEDGTGFSYLNAGHGTDSWTNLGKTAKPATVHKRENIRMAVLTSSGRADYTVVEEDTGRASWWQNTGAGGNWQWQARGVFAEGPKNTVETKFGVRFTGKTVQFADLNGDGYDDYLYITETGNVIMWENLKTDPITWGLPVQVTDKQVRVSPFDVRFGDTNGDGRVDYIVVDGVDGGIRVWQNLGFNQDESILWSESVRVSTGSSAGHAIKVADMTGDGRADYMSVNPDSGAVNLWKNLCV